MKIFEAIERLSCLHSLIKAEKTGSPELLSKQLGISRSSLYNMIDELKSYDAPISYSRAKETFFYTKDFELEFKCTMSIIEDEDILKKIVGGSEFFSSVLIFGLNTGNFTFSKSNRLTIGSDINLKNKTL